MFSSDVTEPKQRYEFLAIKREMLLKNTNISLVLVSQDTETV